jgi:hypothetical protein
MDDRRLADGPLVHDEEGVPGELALARPGRTQNPLETGCWTGRGFWRLAHAAAPSAHAGVVTLPHRTARVVVVA